MSKEESNPTPNPIAAEIIAGLEAFAADLQAGRLDQGKYRITTMWHNGQTCPECGGAIVQTSRTMACARPGCRYSWNPSAEDTSS